MKTTLAVAVPTLVPILAIDLEPKCSHYVSMAGRQVLASGEADLEELSRVVAVTKRPVFLLSGGEMDFAVGYLLGSGRVPLSEWARRLVSRAELLRFLGLPATLHRGHKRVLADGVVRRLGGTRAAYGTASAPGPLRGVRGYWLALGLALMVTDGKGKRFPASLYADREFV